MDEFQIFPTVRRDDFWLHWRAGAPMLAHALQQRWILECRLRVRMAFGCLVCAPAQNAIDMTTGYPYIFRARTVIETLTFQRQADDFWSEDERLDFLSWLAGNPEAGDVVPGAEGARKVRWTLPGIGKRGGVRVIYFNDAEDGTVLLVMMYAKGDRDNVNAVDIKRAL